MSTRRRLIAGAVVAALSAVGAVPAAVASPAPAAEAAAAYSQSDHEHEHGEAHDEPAAGEALAGIGGTESVTVLGSVAPISHTSDAYVLTVEGVGFLPAVLDGVDSADVEGIQKVTVRVPADFPQTESDEETFAALEKVVNAGDGAAVAVIGVRDLQTTKAATTAGAALTPRVNTIWAVPASPKGGSTTLQPSQSRERIESAVEAVDTYFRGQSGGRFGITLGKYTSLFKSNQKCDIPGSIAMWNAAAQHAGFTFRNGHHLVLFFAEEFDTGLCNYGVAGMAQINASPASGGALWVLGTDSPHARGTLAHELGHNFGLRHANLARCESGVPDFNNKTACPEYYEYSDLWDMMSSREDGYFKGSLSSPGAIGIGFWGSSDYHVAQAGTATYELNAVSTTTGKRAIVVTDPIKKNKYYIELRTFHGPDAHIGEIISSSYGREHWGEGVRILQVDYGSYVWGTFVLPSEPETPDEYDVKRTFYQQGDEFTTRSGGTTMRVLDFNKAENTATVEVTVRSTNVAAPVVAGTAQYNQTLNADISSWTTSFPGTTGITYQWYRDDKAISGEAAKTASYLTTAADIGKRLSVKVSATLGGVNVKVSKTSAKTAKVAALAIVSTPAVITGTPRVGEELLVDASQWDLAPGGTHPLRVTYQWYRSGTAIKNATASSHILVAADLGKTMTVKVTGKSTGYTSVSKTSAKTAKVARGIIAGELAPTVSLDPVAMKLTAAPAGLTEPGVKYSYQWLRNGSSISKATKSSYTLTTSDRKKSISVRVTATKSGYSTISTTTAPVNYTVAVDGAAPQLENAWEAAVGITLTLQPRTIENEAAIHYQWLRDGKAIKLANSDTYVVTTADIGKVLSVTTTVTKPGTLPHISTSAKTQKVRAFAFAEQLAVGQERVDPERPTLRVTFTSGFDETAKYSYQWLRNGKAISRATKSTYTLTSSDRDKLISVRVTQTKTSHTSQVATSASASYTIAVDGAPTIIGATKVGRPLSVSVADSDPLEAAVRVQWLRNGVAVSGATNMVYVLGSADVGKKLSVRVTYTAPGYISKTVTSAKTATIAK